MCLRVKDFRIRRAEHDISVFKVLTRINDEYYSPCYPTKWEQGETKTVPTFSGKFRFGQYRNIRFNDQIPPSIDEIFEGLHSFFVVPAWMMGVYAVVKMTIPKDTKYIVGKADDVVSLALRFD